MILVSGCAGFIGNALCLKLLESGSTVLGVDNLNAYYDVRLKEARMKRLDGLPGFVFECYDIREKGRIADLIQAFDVEIVVHLAAQAGVRHSLDHPQDYIDNNITGFLNILEACRTHCIKHLVYASSSSVYGMNDELPFSVDHRTDEPANLYAVTKKSNELMATAYQYLYGLHSTGLRFFTVYGPWGRPDMAFFKFVKAIIAGEPIDVYNHGNHTRAFTYIDDIVDGILKVVHGGGKGNQIYNIGGDESVALLDAIGLIEKAVDKQAILNLLPMQPGDVIGTCAEPSRIPEWRPKIKLEEGIKRFVEWYRNYHHV